MQVRAATTCGDLHNRWDLMYRMAGDELGHDDGLILHRVFPEGNARIQLYPPVLPLSRNAVRIDSLRQALTVCRMVFGKLRQDDVLEFIRRGVHRDRRQDLVTSLKIDLLPQARYLLSLVTLNMDTGKLTTGCPF